MKTINITYYGTPYTVIELLDGTIEVHSWMRVYGSPIDFTDLPPSLQSQLLDKLSQFDDSNFDTN